MIQMAISPEARQYVAGLLLKEIGVQPCMDMQAMLWVNKDNEIEWIVGYTAWIGKTCQMHVVNLKEKPISRTLLHGAFDYAFNHCGLEKVFGIVNSKNVRAMSFDTKIGFKEAHRFVGMHDDGGDLVVLEMDKADCKWIRELKHAA
jgi:RimJ/RimL family protein N-acetyltransferase